MPHYTTTFLYCFHKICCYIVHCVYIGLCLITLLPFIYCRPNILCYTVCIQWIMPTYTTTIFLLLPQQTLLNFTLCIYWITPYYTAAILYCHHYILCYIVHSMYTFDFALLHRHLFYTAATTYIITLYTVCIH